MKESHLFILCSWDKTGNGEREARDGFSYPSADSDSAAMDLTTEQKYVEKAASPLNMCRHLFPDIITLTF
jgi:hypothetical protein